MTWIFAYLCISAWGDSITHTNIWVACYPELLRVHADLHIAQKLPHWNQDRCVW